MTELSEGEESTEVIAFRRFPNRASGGSPPGQRRVVRALALGVLQGGEEFCRLVDLASGELPMADARDSGQELVHVGLLVGGEGFRVFLGRGRKAFRGETNVWLGILADRLGVEVAEVRRWRPYGDALVTGVSGCGAATSVSERVIGEARACGLIMTSLGVNGFADELPGPGPGPLADVVLVGHRWRISMEVVLDSGRAQTVAIWVNDEHDSVALEFAPGRLVAFERAQVRAWLSRALSSLTSPTLGAGFVLEATPAGPRPAVLIPGAPLWALSPRILAHLRELA